MYILQNVWTLYLKNEKKREFTTKIGAGGAVALCSHIKYCVIHTNCILECINMYQFLQKYTPFEGLAITTVHSATGYGCAFPMM